MISIPPDAPTPIGRSPLFQETMADVSRMAPLSRPVLLVGERGTGKELIAARLHYLSPRWNQPFLKLNCGGLTDSLLETELFGHEAGAFTGAQRRRLGRFELAHRGTLFLDEIANAPMTVQETILRVVEYGSFERVGGSETVEVDVRLVAATNEDLPSLAANGRFRADLLDRLAFDVMTLPPLRERPEDIEVLSEHFALRMSQELRRDVFPGFTTRASATLLGHSWPGNVRELKNVVERAVYRTDPGRKVDNIVLDPFVSPWRPAPSREAGNAGPAMTDGIAPPSGPYDFAAHVRHLERSLLHQALLANDHHQKRTAAFLGMTYHQLRGQLLKHDLIGRE
ncbi:phage shock protein operon transcriptional activator [Telmatospirillum siberiense]|uniref:Phage shock protein operon transcriptional activator n=1 Tax=Telmatospirillum siberiense TaxID=382514 RepID=A0A2N3PYW4_9PROT|nr:phage shock protein operon transcriptional activator [Telmatospirillum siberiense]PKU25569.1 phage shock protein operon transcriptional activator [Telmatospirillum siberiense]